MIDDVDWKLLNDRLESIERSIEMLKAMFPVQQDIPTPYESVIVPYVLAEGSLTDAGKPQLWRTISFDKPVDCVSTISIEDMQVGCINLDVVEGAL